MSFAAAYSPAAAQIYVPAGTDYVSQRTDGQDPLAHR
jgi:hypothetical protein